MVCYKLHKSRAAYYKFLKQGCLKEQQYGMIAQKVQNHRKLMPRIGGRKLFYLLGDYLKEHNIKIGRDNFFKCLKQYDLLVPHRKRRYAITTDSRHPFKVYENLTTEMEVNRSNQLWVSDITYLRLKTGFCYLALITDAHSRKIVGYDVSDSLELTGCVRALKMAKKGLLSKNITTIHHSDRGSQYCSYAYIDELKKNDISISMAAAGNCYENAMAERINGILKTEFNLDATFKNLAQAKMTTKQVINIYNNDRPHLSLKMKTPNKMYNLKTNLIN